MHQACQRSGRDPQTVQLVCVTKTVPLETIRQVVALGVADLGENRVQEAREKQPSLPRPSIRWHLIGHLQRKKAHDAVELFDVIHSVDSVRLAEELERRTQGKQLDVFVQVNVSGEATKSGCTPDEAEQLAQAVLRLPHLRLQGLMTIPPFSENPEDARPHFRHLRELRDELSQSLSHVATWPLALSMGMSNDFEVAIEEGADVIRIGTAIFGDRRPETRDQRPI